MNQQPVEQVAGERSCPKCSARNQPAAAFCWQCLTPFTSISAGTPGVPHPVRDPMPDLALALDRSGSGVTPNGRGAGRIVVAAFAVIALIAGAFVVMSRADGGRPGLPDDVIGFERLDTPQARDVQEVVARPLVDGRGFDGAAYGAGDEIELTLGVIGGDTGYGPEAIYFMVSQAIAGEASASSLQGRNGDRGYSCGRMGRGAVCTWVGPQDTGFLAMRQTTPASLEGALAQVLDEVDGG